MTSSSISLSGPQSSDSHLCSYPLSHYICSHKFTPGCKGFLAAITENIKPSRFSEVIPHSHWQEAMQIEIDALERNHAWHFTSLPPDKKDLGCKWVYKINRKSDGSIETCKARLVILGNNQIEGLDYHMRSLLLLQIWSQFVLS